MRRSKKSMSLPPAPSWALVRVGLLAVCLLVLAACGPEKPTRGPVPRRPAGPGEHMTKPPPRPNYTAVGPRRVSAKPGVDVTREPLTRLIRDYTGEDEAAALHLTEQARLELERGTTTHAFELLDAAIEREPDSIPPYVVRARAYLAEGSASRARDDLREAVDLEPPTPWLAEVVALNGAIFELEGNGDAAVAAYRRALQISAANVTAREALRRISSP